MSKNFQIEFGANALRRIYHLNDSVNMLKAVMIAKALSKKNGIKTDAAAFLGLKRTTLVEMIKTLERNGFHIKEA